MNKRTFHWYYRDSCQKELTNHESTQRWKVESKLLFDWVLKSIKSKKWLQWTFNFHLSKVNMVACSTVFYRRPLRQPFAFSLPNRVYYFLSPGYNQSWLQITSEAAQLSDQLLSQETNQGRMVAQRYPSLSHTWAPLLFGGPLFILAQLNFK